MKLRSSLPLLLIATTAAAQTATTPKKPATPAHHTTTSTAAKKTTATVTTSEANPADNPPNVPKVEGTPKPLYALRYIDTQIGTGDLAKTRQFYTVHYTGWLTNGTKFDSSFDHPGAEPITFPAGAHRVIPGWDTGFQGMHVGGKRRLFIPYQLAYGEAGRPPHIPAKSDLIFDIELVSVSDTPPAPKAPPAPPTNPTAPPTKPSDAPANPAAEPTKPQTPPPTPPPP